MAPPRVRGGAGRGWGAGGGGGGGTPAGGGGGGGGARLCRPRSPQPPLGSSIRRATGGPGAAQGLEAWRPLVRIESMGSLFVTIGRHSHSRALALELRLQPKVPIVTVTVIQP